MATIERNRRMSASAAVHLVWDDADRIRLRPIARFAQLQRACRGYGTVAIACRAESPLRAIAGSSETRQLNDDTLCRKVDFRRQSGRDIRDAPCTITLQTLS
jgi:hypothetical protein